MKVKIKNIMIYRQKQLEKLRRKVIDRVCKKGWKDVWFYPRYKKIKGYLGTQNLVFIGPNPSYNRFPTKCTDFFYEQLEKNGFENAHLTDLVKIRAFNKDSKNMLNDKNIINEQLEFLKEEFDIVKPKLIVVLGKGWKSKKVKEILEENFKDIEIKNIYHYSSIIFQSKNRIKFIKDMKCIRHLSLKRQI